MVRRAVTEQAKGIIMAGRHCTAEEASAILQTASEQADRAPDDLAAALVARVVQQPRKIR
jgi:AmiR/NasT family two-component response regulator